ncbi:BPSS1187 family protein [Frondihabitans peucedani]|uniref:Alpha/beta hydrolase family protein n=1 Tax=Frondihabitans peucedani TaxID=598626 RepID=A0ABP8E4C1_9MICO
MKFRRWPHGLAALIALCIAVLVLVSVETGSVTRPTAATTTRPLPGLSPTEPPVPGSRGGAGREGEGHQAATGGSGVVAGGTDPASRDLTMNPFNFRLGLINGTVVKPDARDWAARTVETGPLLLFLPATGHVPNNYRKFLTVAAEQGYHVLGLDFWNQGKSVAKTCGVDARCYTEVQRNRFNGYGPSRFSKVDEANSVLARLHAALDYLVKHDPDGGWDQYTTDESIHWNRIVVAGHSQGGGEAAYIAHRTRVLGQLTFASPIITDEDTRASWLRQKGKTPTSVMYGFDDRDDIYYPRIEASWRELGMGRHPLTARVPVPSATTAKTVHTLVTTADIGDPHLSHLRTITDLTPMTSKGRPLFLPVWEWMLRAVYPTPSADEKGVSRAE